MCGFIGSGGTGPSGDEIAAPGLELHLLDDVIAELGIAD